LVINSRIFKIKTMAENSNESVAKTATEQSSAAASSSQRTVSIVTTRGERRKIAYSGNDWEGLKNLIERGGKDIEGNSFSGYDLRNMKCVEGVRRTTLEHPKAEIPEGNFNLFLMPYKSKAGGEARDKVKAICFTE
jgi:hypothetical protein